MVKGEKEDRRVKCVACGKPIKMDDLGGIFSGGKLGLVMIHKNIVCLAGYFIKKEREEK